MPTLDAGTQILTDEFAPAGTIAGPASFAPTAVHAPAELDSPGTTIVVDAAPRPDATPRSPAGSARAGRHMPYRIRPEGNRDYGYRLVKRLFDISGAIAFLVLFSPIMIAVYLVLLVTTKGRPIFAQVRVGYQGREFRMYKFRTMRLDADRVQHMVANEQSGPVFKNRCDPRITRIGRILRSTSIDEMPQLINVLLGHMSLVGPRPPVPKEVAQYHPWQRRRLSIKPGLTCIWQVSGRCEIGFEDWVRMDIRYAKKQSLRTDLKLLARTPISVLSRRGAY